MRALRKIVAEMVGTFALVFAGCGAIMVNEQTGGSITHLGVGLTFGLVIMVMIYATGHVSGAHFNPAVTVAFAATGRFPWKEVPGYMSGQLLAALAASLALRFLIGPIAGLGATSPSGTLGQAVVLEAFLTFFLMFVIMSVATDGRAVGSMAGWAIGGTVALEAIFAGPLTGASMNPARSLGPALVAGDLSHLWVYLIGPAIGAVIGAMTYRFVRCGGDELAAKGCC